MPDAVAAVASQPMRQAQDQHVLAERWALRGRRAR
jgi:hypothetical protein